MKRNNVRLLIAVVIGMVTTPCTATHAQTEDAAIAEAKIREAGGLVQQISAQDPWVEVSLYLAGKNVNDELVRQIDRIENVRWVNLASTSVTDEGLKPIGRIKTITRLHLEKTGIGDAGIDHLLKLEQLEYLNLYGTKVTDAGLVKLAALKNLKKVYVWQSQVTDQGIAELKSLRPDMEIVGAVNLEAKVIAEPVEQATEEKSGESTDKPEAGEPDKSKEASPPPDAEPSGEAKSKTDESNPETGKSKPDGKGSI